MSQFAALASILNQQGAVVPPPWSPTDLTGLVAWYDASDTATITATGGNVTDWNDKSGNGYHLQDIAGTPVTGSATINGLNVLSYTDDSLQNASVPMSGASRTWFIVIEINASDTSYIVAAVPNTGPWLYLATSGSSNTGINNGVTSTSLYVNGSLFSGTTRGDVFTAIGTGTPKIVRPTGTFTGQNGVALSYNGGGFGYGSGTKLAEVIICETPSAEDITATESYLTTKWGL